jgi:hypothetical protein
MLVEAPNAFYRRAHRKRHRVAECSRIKSAWRRIGWSIPDAMGMRSPHSEDVLGRQAKEDLADSFVVQDPSLSLLRDRVDVTQPSLERIFLEHRH